jgi:hypothetical protein
LREPGVPEVPDPDGAVVGSGDHSVLATHICGRPAHLPDWRRAGQAHTSVSGRTQGIAGASRPRRCERLSHTWPRSRAAACGKGLPRNYAVRASAAAATAHTKTEPSGQPVTSLSAAGAQATVHSAACRVPSTAARWRGQRTPARRPPPRPRLAPGARTPPAARRQAPRPAAPSNCSSAFEIGRGCWPRPAAAPILPVFGVALLRDSLSIF